MYEWTVVIKPCSIPNSSCKTFTGGARLFVVQDAIEIILCFCASYVFSFTPKTIVASGSLPGADITTFFAPAPRCFDAPSRLRNTPVDSTTASMFNFFQGRLDGFNSEKNSMRLPLTSMPLVFATTSPSNLP